MIKSSKESDNVPLKQEGQHLSDNVKAKAASSMSPSPSSQWLRLKDPRIVSVSRAFGGKDRHSKVCTIRGLRDRRVRLSVPTAIQLYDLQYRLGLNQPGKVVDWLLNAAKHEINELPPLPIPPGNFNYMINRSNIQWEGSTSKSKQVSGEAVVAEKLPTWINSSEEGHKQESINNECHDEEGAHALQNSLLSIRPNHPSFLGFLNNMPLGNYQWDSSSSDVSNQLVTNVVPFSSTLSLSTGASQILVCPSGATTQSFLPSSHVAATEMDPRQINHYHHDQIFNSSSSQNLFTCSMIPSQNLFSLNMMTPKLLHSPNSSESPSHS